MLATTKIKLGNNCAPASEGACTSYFSLDSLPDVKFQLRNLRIFLSVVGARSISRAAEQLYKTPAAIARTTSKFERVLGSPLFERKPRGMTLNKYGEAVLLRASRIHDEIQRTAKYFLDGRSESLPPLHNAVINILSNVRTLHLLINLTTFRHFQTAAAQTKMSPSRAALEISRIEAALGQPILKRRAQDSLSTGATKRLAACAHRVLVELREMRSDILVISQHFAGSVVIGMTVLGSSFVLPAAIARAIASRPELRVTTLEGTYEQMLTKLHSGDVDFAFGALRPSYLNHGLRTEPLITDRLAVVVRPGHALALRNKLQLSELMAEKWILPTLGRRLIVDDSFRKLGLQPPSPSIEANDAAMLKHLLHASDMLAMISPDQLMSEITSGLLVELPVELGEVTREIGLLVRDGATLSPAALAVMDAVRAEVRRARKFQHGHVS